MKPIQELISRIRWDPEFGGAEFAIGYYDRTADRVRVVPFREIHFPENGPALFELIDHQGLIHSIPLHRVRQVFRNGDLIWERL
jgi:uncharacterized protein (UPF0248 family)